MLTVQSYFESLHNIAKRKIVFNFILYCFLNSIKYFSTEKYLDIQKIYFYILICTDWQENRSDELVGTCANPIKNSWLVSKSKSGNISGSCSCFETQSWYAWWWKLIIALEYIWNNKIKSECFVDIYWHNFASCCIFPQYSLYRIVKRFFLGFQYFPYLK